MADPLSISASVAGLLSLAITVADTTYQYVSTAKSAPSTIAALFAELQALKGVLVKLDDITHNSESKTFSSLPLLDIKSCKVDLEKIQQKLKKRLGTGGSMNPVQRLAWPLLESNTMQLVKQLHRYVEIFHVTLSTDSFNLNKATLEEIKGLRAEVKLDQRQKTIITWLSPESHASVHESIRSQRQKDTGQWFLDKLTEVEWPSATSSKPLFWCRGIPGAGKTILTSLVIDHFCSSTENWSLGYYYFNYKHQDSQKLENVLFSLLAQLLHKIPELWTGVETFYDQFQASHSMPSLDDTIQMLLGISDTTKVILVFDALDEAPTKTRDGLFQHLAKFTKAGFRIFVTSRPDIQLRQVRESASILDLTANKDDLRLYAASYLQESANVQDILDGQSSDISDRLVELVIERAAGMFLLVVFQTEHICNQTSGREMLNAAKNMPSDPNEVYARTMQQIKSQSPNQARLAKRVLSWLTLALESLTPEALSVALAVDKNSTELDPLNKPSPAMLAKVCRGLVILDEENNIIELAHRTVQEYLWDSFETGPEGLFSAAQAEISSTCLTYLSFDIFKAAKIPHWQAFNLRRNEYAFLSYAAWYLPEHLLCAYDDDDLLERMYLFINCQPLVDNFLKEGRLSFRGENGFSESLSGSQSMTQLHVASIIGHGRLVDMILSHSPHLIDMVDQEKNGRSALDWAVREGRDKAVCALLKAGANMDSGYPETPLNCAARLRHNGIAKLLMGYQYPKAGGSESDVQALERQHFLVGAMTGDAKAVKESLLRGVEVDARDVDGGTALQWASWYGHLKIIDILLESGADVDAADYTSGRHAIHEAAENGQTEVLRFLLKRGADVNALDKWNFTPLHRAAFRGGADNVRLLIDNGADSSAKTKSRENALDLACRNAQVESIRLLLDVGDSIIASSQFHKTGLRFGRQEVRAALMDGLRKSRSESPIDDRGT